MTVYLGCPCLLLLTSAILMTSCGGFPDPPVMPDQFTVNFDEIRQYTFVHQGQVISLNNGSLYYDFTHGRARLDVNGGQFDPFCQNQNLSDHDPRGPCQLYFHTTGDLFVHYPERKTCCRLCGKPEGCGLRRPDWLHHAYVIETEYIMERYCQDWNNPDVTTVIQTMLLTHKGDPCRYSELLHGQTVAHNQTFITGSYQVAPQKPSLFTVPSYCSRTCPRPFPTAGLHHTYPMFGRGLGEKFVVNTQT